MTRLMICIGSNVADCRDRIDRAIALLDDLMTIEAVSDVVTSPDRSGRGRPYANCVVKGTTEIDFTEFADALRDFERRLGRTPLSKESGIMPADIDIVERDAQILSPHDHKSPYYRTCLTSLHCCLKGSRKGTENAKKN